MHSFGVDLIAGLQRRRLPDLAIRLKEVCVVVLGGLCAYLASRTLQSAEWSPGWGLLLLPAIFLIGYLVRKGISPLLLISSVAGLVVLLVWML